MSTSSEGNRAVSPTASKYFEEMCREDTNLVTFYLCVTQVSHLGKEFAQKKKILDYWMTTGLCKDLGSLRCLNL